MRGWLFNLKTVNAAGTEANADNLAGSGGAAITLGKPIYKRVNMYSNDTTTAIQNNLTVSGHIANSTTSADAGSDIANTAAALALAWTDTHKTYKSVHAGNAAKTVTLAAATSADIGKKITIPYTATRAADNALIFTLTTQTLDTASYIKTLTNAGISEFTFASAGHNTITTTPAATNAKADVGTIITFEVISVTEIRCTVICSPLGNGSAGSVAFS